MAPGAQHGQLAVWLRDGNPPPQPDWETLIEVAANNGVLQSLEFTPSDESLAQIVVLLATVHSLNTARNLTALRQVRQLTFALNRVGIEPVALKGIANILSGIYPSFGTRYIADVDLLVSPHQFPAALAVFKDCGYSADPAHPIEVSIGHTYPPFIRPDSLEIDLHRTLGLHPCQSLLPAAELIKGSAPCGIDVHAFRLTTSAEHTPIDKQETATYSPSDEPSTSSPLILVPSPTHLLTHHIMHSQMHDVYHERIAPSLRTLYDFYLLQKRLGTKIDWSSIESRFCQSGHYTTLALYLLQVQDTFEIAPPIPLRLTPSIRLRHARRRFLQRHPTARLFDPAYYWGAGVQPRTRRLHEILAQPGGLHYLVQKFYNPAFYARLKSDFRR